MTFDQIRDAINSAFRDYVVEGVPASGDHEPVKQEIRSALALLVIALDDGGFTAPPDWAADLADVVSQLEAIDAAVASTDADRIAAETAATNANGYAGTAVTARDQAITAAELAGGYAFFDTYADAVEGLAGVAADGIVQVWADENHSGHRTTYKKVSGVLVFKRDLDIGWLTVFTERFALPEDFTSEANDTDMIRAAITAASVGGQVLLKPGKTYTLHGGIEPLADQTVLAYGAKVKVCNEIQSTTSTAVETGTVTVTVTVASGTNFRVGQDVTIYDGSGYDPNPHRITAVSGNDITMSGNFTVAFPSGGTVLVAFCAFYLANSPGAKVLGLTIDGNRANNTTLPRWSLQIGIWTGDRGVVRDCYLHDMIAEGIIQGGEGAGITENWFKDIGGNPIHVSGGQGLKAVGNWIKNGNLGGEDVQHSDGGIIFSDDCSDVFIAYNHIENCKSGIASIDTLGNSSVVVHGNIVRDCTASGLEGSYPPGETGGIVTVTENKFYDCQEVALVYTPGSYDSAEGPKRWTVANNYFENTQLKLTGAENAKVIDNDLNFAGDTTTPAMTLTNVVGVQVEGNTVVGGVNAILVLGSSTARLRISRNAMHNQYERAVNWIAHSGIACACDGNTVTVDSGFTTASSYVGILIPNETRVFDNDLDIHPTASGTPYGIYCPSGGASDNGAFVNRNVIRSTNLSASIKADGGSQKNIITDNYVQQAIVVGGGGANTVSGNLTIS